MRIYIYLLLITLLSACATSKNFSKFHRKHEMRAADSCAKWYPIKDSTITKTVYKQGEEIYLPGTPQFVSVDCDSIVRANKGKNGGGKTNTVRIPVPGPERIDTFIKYTDHYIENTAYKAVLRDSIALLKKENNKTATKLSGVEKTRNTLWWIVIILGLLTVGSLYLKIAKKTII